MLLSKLIEVVRKRNRKSERVKAVKKLAVGMGVAGAAIGMIFASILHIKKKNRNEENLSMAEKFNNEINTQAETLKDTASNIEDEIEETVKEVRKKTERVKEDIKDGLQETKKDIHKTVNSVAKELENQ